MPGSVVGTGKKVTLTVSTSGIDSGEQADILIYKKIDNKQLDSLQSKVKDNLITAEWEAKGPGPDDKEQGWDVYYKAKCKGLETKATPMFVYTDWVEVESVDEDGKSLPDASFTLSVKGGGEPRTRTTGTAGKRKEEHLPPGEVTIKWNKPYKLIEWVDQDGPKRKAKLKVVPVAKLVSPKKGEHTQWVNLKADEAKPEQGSKLKLKVTLEGGGAKKGSKVYAKVVFDEKAVSARNDPAPRLFEGGISADWCKQGGEEGELAGDPPAKDHEAVFDLELGLAGGDQVTVWVGGSEECDDEKVVITNWRKIYHQVTKPKPMTPHDAAPLKAALDEVFVDYEKYKTVDIDPADKGIPAGSWMDGAEFGLPGKKLLNIGDHNSSWFRGKFDDSKTPLGCHLMLCDKQYDGGESGSYHEQTIEVEGVTTDTKEVKINEAGSFDVFAIAIQDGNAAIQSGSKWTSTAPSGHPMNGKSGDITADMCTINNHTNRDHIVVKLPTGTAGDGKPATGKDAKDASTKHPVKLKLVVRVARGPFLGESDGKHQLIVLSPNAKAFSATLGHELGHSIRQALKEVAPGLDKAKHTRLYTGKGHQGEHCATGLSDDDFKKASFKGLALGSCIMYGALSPKDDPPTGRFCEACLPFVRADHCQSLAGAGALSEKADMCSLDDEAGVCELQPSVSLCSVNAGGPERFAPCAETLDLYFEMQGMESENLVLQVEATQHDPPVVYSAALSASEKGTGTFIVRWDGKTNCTSGPLTGRFADPLHSPYKVKLLRGDESVAAEVDIQVLYHSVELRHAPHVRTPPPQSERVKYIQWKLNVLGYDAGAVDGVDAGERGEALKRAIKRFQRAHYKVGTTTLLAENGDKDDADFFQKLVSLHQHRDRRVIFEAGKDPFREDCKYLQRDNYMSDRGEDFITTTLPQFSSKDRKTHAEDKMDRPFIPLQAVVKLVSKTGRAVEAPQAVGPVKVAWGLVDTTQNLNVVQADNAAQGTVARTYVERAAKYGGSGTADLSVGAAARIDGNGDNCPTTHWGWRKSDPAANVQAHFPATAESRLLPWAAPTYADFSRGGTTFKAAVVPCFQGRAGTTDAYDGRSGLYFRFSTKGGDTARVRAAITFEGLPNKADLETAHQPYAATLLAQTGLWTVWRHTRVSAYCRMAAPTRRPSTPNWAQIRGWWNEAFIEVADQGNPALNLDYGTVVPGPVYTAALNALPAGKKPAGTITYRAGGLYGGDALVQDKANGETAAQFIARATVAMKNWVIANDDAVVNAILKVIHAKARETSPEGFVLFDFRIHPPLSGEDQAADGSWGPTADPSAQNILTPHRGWVRVDGAVTLSLDNRADVSNYILHECGHARFLRHHLHAGDSIDAATVAHRDMDLANHHDGDHPRCTMSYSHGGDAIWDIRYPFCGKCIMRLRGWDISKLPNKYTA